MKNVDSLQMRRWLRDKFGDIFHNVMALVENTADYLDKDGRTESRSLERSAQLSYATQSMRLTTLLMQMATWVLRVRCIQEYEITADDFKKDKKSIRLSAQQRLREADVLALPVAFQALASRTNDLLDVLIRADCDFFSEMPGNASEQGRAQRST